jgi:hypothetical protein
LIFVGANSILRPLEEVDPETENFWASKALALLVAILFRAPKKSPFSGPTPSMALEMDLPVSKSLRQRPKQQEHK